MMLGNQGSQGFLAFQTSRPDAGKITIGGTWTVAGSWAAGARPHPHASVLHVTQDPVRFAGRCCHWLSLIDATGDVGHAHMYVRLGRHFPAHHM